MMLCIAVAVHSFSCWLYACGEGHLNSDDVVAVDNLVLLSVVGVVGVWGGVETYSEAW